MQWHIRSKLIKINKIKINDIYQQVNRNIKITTILNKLTMGIFEKIKNTIEPNELKRKKSHLKNLYSVAMADGKLTNEEFDFLLSVANKLYINPSVVQSIVHFPEDISFYVPPHDREKLDQIYDCVCMAVIDGEFNERESSICKLISVKLGFRPVVVDHIVEHILHSVILGVASDIALTKLLTEI